MGIRWLILPLFYTVLTTVMSLETVGTLQCKSPETITNTTQTLLFLECSAENIPQKGQCSFNYRGLPNTITPDITWTHSKNQNKPQNFNIYCSWSLDLSGVGEGTIYIQGVVETNNTTIISKWTEPVKLSYPTVSLSTDCPTGPSRKDRLILEGTPFTCRCELMSPGYPAGFAQWFDNHGTSIGGSQKNGSAILEESFAKRKSEFYCWAMTALKETEPKKVLFRPRIAFGPTQITIDMSDAIPLCPAESFTYQITCKVPSNNVLPRPLFTIIINNETVVDNRAGEYEEARSKFFLTHTFRPKAGGALRIYCKAVNELFQERFTFHERQLIIKEPPKMAPTLKSLSGQTSSDDHVVRIRADSEVHLTCAVDGGYPEVTETTIACGTSSVSKPGNVADLNLVVPNGANYIICRCTANHISGCYKQRAEITLQPEKQETSNNITAITAAPVTSSSNSFTLIIGLSVGLGCVILLLVVILVSVIFCLRRRTQNGTYTQPDFNSCNSYQYASFRPALPDRQAKPEQPASFYVGDYDVIGLSTGQSQTSLKGIEVPLKQKTKDDSFGQEQDYLSLKRESANSLTRKKIADSSEHSLKRESADSLTRKKIADSSEHSLKRESADSLTRKKLADFSERSRATNSYIQPL